jgi:phosphate transport system ATP-binding protein
LDFAAGTVTALIGPSGCGKSTFIRTLNRMHEFIPTAALAGEVLLDGQDIYAPGTDVTKIRLRVGMVFQKPNPFPSMTIGENVLSGLKLAQLKRSNTDEILESCLVRAGLWSEVKDRLGEHGGALSGGQQQRLCIARSLAVAPQVLLMDEPCSALDPGSTFRIEETISELAKTMTIVIVTHNMQQAARVSDYTAFFLSDGGPGVMVEAAPTSKIFSSPQDKRTEDYVTGRFG